MLCLRCVLFGLQLGPGDAQEARYVRATQAAATKRDNQGTSQHRSLIQRQPCESARESGLCPGNARNHLDRATHIFPLEGHQTPSV